MDGQPYRRAIHGRASPLAAHILVASMYMVLTILTTLTILTILTTLTILTIPAAHILVASMLVS